MNLALRPITFSLGLILLVASGCKKPVAAKSGDGLKVRLEAIRQAREPVTLAELNAWYPAPPVGQDAGGLLDQAFAQLTKGDTKSPDFLAKNQRVLPLLHEAAALGKCRYPTDLTLGLSAPLTHVAAVKRCVLLLAAEAVHQAETGPADRAAQALLDGLAVARTLEPEPTLISQLVRGAGETACVNALGQALNRRAFGAADLVRLQTVLGEAEADSGKSLTRALVGERCFDLNVCQLSADDLAKLPDLLGLEARGPFTAEDLRRYHGTATWAKDAEFLVEYLTAEIAASRLPYPRLLEVFAANSVRLDEARSRGYILSQLLLRDLGSSVEKAGVVAADCRVARAALAVERHRLAHAGAVPATLAELVPAFLEVVPTDPFDGQPLRFQKHPASGYVIYSLGRDRRDDGGRPEEKGSGDVAFRIRR